ncbi:unnamed protein product [Caenorhabditis angaria]|uniref:Peptidase M14 domain-containing protein n=1 Tax=Caenorhabditis angaria TaxID=860376 RepID=A0A9P1N5E5_9PELO|nr:unnamed protein product [Caenorhabditis angaria]
MFLRFGICLILFIFLNQHVTASYKSYDGYKILEVPFKHKIAKRYVQNIDKHFGFMPDFLGENWKKEEAHFFIEKDQVAKVGDALKFSNISFNLRDVDSKMFTFSRKRRDLANSPISITDINTRYLSYDEQIQFLNNLASQFPNLVKLQNLGNSYEGRPITAVRLGDDGTNKPIVWIDAGIHAREWISYNAALYFIWTILNDPNYRQLLQNVQVNVVPNTNPDGYEYSRTTERMWRKTRSRFTSSKCAGTDGNRNYPFFWGNEGVSHSTCSEIYCGTRAASEPEVLALTNAIMREERRIKAYVSLHSYGQEILYPWGHTKNSHPSDVQDLIRVGKMMATAIQNLHGTQYNVMNSGDGLYPAAGASDDWAKSRGIKYSFTMELSPSDDYTGFILPEDRIFQVNRETFQALTTLVRVVSQEFANRTTTSTTRISAKFQRTRGFGSGK